MKKETLTYLERAIQDGLASISGEGKKQRIHYHAVDHSERYSDPEEKVRAEYWAELIYRYDYKPEFIGIELTVPDRVPGDRADLVVFVDAARKRPFAVIECKRDSVTEAEFEQAVEQAAGNGTWAKFRAKYIGVIAGKLRRRFLDCSEKYGVLEREANKIADLPKKYGKPEEWRFRKNTREDIAPVNREDLIKTIRNCHQSLWGGGRLSPPAAFGEFCKILFVKISDEQAKRKNGEPYQFQVKTHEDDRKLAQRIRNLYEEAQDRDPDVLTDTIKVDDATLRALVEHMEGIDYTKTDLDTKGVAFEQFMDGFFKGDFGQYFTPREIIAFAVEIVQPGNDELVLDPACGSGGFLLYALDHVRREASEYFPEHETDPKDAQGHFRYWHDFAEKRLFGIEINDEIARVAKMNMIVHDDGHTNIVGGDALDKIEKLTAQNAGFSRDRFDVVLTNPPFGAMVKRTEKPYLTDYTLSRYETRSRKMSGSADDSGGYGSGKKAIKQRSSVKTEIIFLERVWELLKPGTGRTAIVLPDGILTNSSLQDVRDWMLAHYQIQAVISLPQAAFFHFGAGVKASLVFLRKRALDEAGDDSEAIFMAVAENIGYDAKGARTYVVSVEEETDGGRIERQECDFLHWRVAKEWIEDEIGDGAWYERHREIIPDTGLVGQYRTFLEDPEPFFV